MTEMDRVRSGRGACCKPDHGIGMRRVGGEDSTFELCVKKRNEWGAEDMARDSRG